MDAARPLIGRAEPLAAVTQALKAGRPVAIVGEAGIGKTSIVRAAAARAGRQLHEGGGLATLSWLPYLALRRAVPLGEAADPERVAATVRRAIGDGVLFVDDLQWADEATRAVVDLLFGSVAVVVAVREGEPDAEATAGRVRRQGALIVRLRGLDSRAVGALAERLMPDAPEPARRLAIEGAGGNPLLIEERAAHGEAPSWLARALLRQLEGLPVAERRALEALATTGRPLPAAALGSAGAALQDRGLLEDGPGGLTLRHRLISDALHRTSQPDPGRPLARRTAEALDRRVQSLAAGIAAGRLSVVATEASALLSEPLGETARHQVLASLGLALGLLGQAEESERTFTEATTMAVAVDGGDPAVCTAWAEASLWGGLPERALELARGALQAGTRDAERVLPSLTRAWAEVELGRRPVPFEPPSSPRSFAGALPEILGLEALGAGNPAAAAASFGASSRLWVGYHLPRALICGWAAGEARRRAGDSAAAASLRATLDAASAIGFEPLAARVRRSLRLAGDRPAPLRAARVAGDPLTARERQVLQLVERGRTNPEIARRMGLGRPTVARILSNAMVKLGAQSRAHAVVLAAGMPESAHARNVAHPHDARPPLLRDPAHAGPT